MHCLNAFHHLTIDHQDYTALTNYPFTLSASLPPVKVSLVDDDYSEFTESFMVNISFSDKIQSPRVSLGQDSATVKILDDDGKLSLACSFSLLFL